MLEVGEEVGVTAELDPQLAKAITETRALIVRAVFDLKICL